MPDPWISPEEAAAVIAAVLEEDGPLAAAARRHVVAAFVGGVEIPWPESDAQMAELLESAVLKARTRRDARDHHTLDHLRD